MRRETNVLLELEENGYKYFGMLKEKGSHGPTQKKMIQRDTGYFIRRRRKYYERNIMRRQKRLFWLV
jgi:hypothetical protein